MRYDGGDSFPFDFDPNGIPSGPKAKGKLSPPSCTIRFGRKWKYSFLSVNPPLNLLLEKSVSYQVERNMDYILYSGTFCFDYEPNGIPF